MEPVEQAVGIRTGIEEERAANGTANALGQKNLIVFLGERGHHEPKDMEKSAYQDGDPRTKLVGHVADNRPLFSC